MATDAQKIDLVEPEQALIRRAVGRMADCAALEFRLMLVNEGSLFLCVALVADLVSRRIRAQLLRAERPVRIVAIVTLDQSFGYPMVERPRKFRPHAHVAGVAEVGRLLFHQVLAFLGMVRRVAIGAPYAVRQVQRAIVVRVVFVVLVTP